MVARLSIIRKNLPRSWVSALSVRHHSKSDTWTPGSRRCVPRMFLMRLYCPPQDKEIIYYLLVHGGNIVIIDPTYTKNIKVDLKCVLCWDLIRACKLAKYPMAVKYLNHTGDKLHCWISLPLCNFWEKNFMQACKVLLYEHQFCTFTI